MAFVDSKHLVVECTLAVAKVVRDKSLAKVVSLESECKRLAQLVADKADKVLSRALSKKKNVVRRVGLVDEEVGRIEKGADIGTETKGCNSVGFDKEKDASS